MGSLPTLARLTAKRNGVIAGGRRRLLIRVVGFIVFSELQHLTSSDLPSSPLTHLQDTSPDTSGRPLS